MQFFFRATGVSVILLKGFEIMKYLNGIILWHF